MSEPSPSSPTSRPRRIPTATLVASVVISLSIATLAATWILRSASEPDTVSPSDLVSGGPASPVSGKARVGQPAPAVNLEYLDGATGTLADLRGKPVILNFWASTCAPCLKEMPAFEAIHQRYGDRVKIVGVNVSEAADPAQKMIARTGVTYPNARDPRGQIIRAFGAALLPHTVAIDAEGTVVSLHNTALTEDELAEIAENLTGEVTR